MTQVNWRSFRREFWSYYRARERDLIAHDRFDDLDIPIPKTIIYDYW